MTGPEIRCSMVSVVVMFLFGEGLWDDGTRQVRCGCGCDKEREHNRSMGVGPPQELTCNHNPQARRQRRCWNQPQDILV